MTTDASLFRWRKDSTNGQTNDVVTDADVLRRASELVERSQSDGFYYTPPIVAAGLRWLASRLESEPSTDGDMKQP